MVLRGIEMLNIEILRLRQHFFSYFTYKWKENSNFALKCGYSARTAKAKSVLTLEFRKKTVIIGGKYMKWHNYVQELTGYSINNIWSQNWKLRTTHKNTHTHTHAQCTPYVHSTVHRPPPFLSQTYWIFSKVSVEIAKLTISYILWHTVVHRQRHRQPPLPFTNLLDIFQTLSWNC